MRVPLPLAQAGVTKLPDEAAAYVTRVHRLGPSDHFTAFDPERVLEADAEIVEVNRQGTTANIGRLRPASHRPERPVTLIQAVCKGEKMDAIVRDATELGATRIVPVIAGRSISRPDPARTERWRRIAIEAARQCGRGDAPMVDVPAKFPQVLPKLAPGHGHSAFCFDPTAAADLGPALAALPARAPVSLLVGPEGGLEVAEIDAAVQAGFQRVTLGAFILRTETVCAAALGALLVSAASRRS